MLGFLDKEMLIKISLPSDHFVPTTSYQKRAIFMWMTIELSLDTSTVRKRITYITKSSV